VLFVIFIAAADSPEIVARRGYDLRCTVAESVRGARRRAGRRSPTPKQSIYRGVWSEPKFDHVPPLFELWKKGVVALVGGAEKELGKAPATTWSGCPG